MDRNNYYNCYEKQLSPFGKKVLHVLIQRWHKEHHGNKINPMQQSHVQKKKMLQFGESNIFKPSLSQIRSRNEFNIITSSNNDITFNLLKETMQSAELLKTIELNNDIDVERHCREDLLYSVNNRHNNKQPFKFLNDERNKLISNNDDEKNKIDENYVNKTCPITWDDMFDTELLYSEKQSLEKDVTLVNNEDRFISDDPEPVVNNIISNKTEFCKDIAGNNKINKKRKKQIKNMDSLPKKIKNDKENSKNILRKENYTKTVKNWLNDVNSHNRLDEEFIENQLNIQTTVNKIVIEKNITSNSSINKPFKKTVQAQLANKNGIMKFSKPRNGINNDTEKAIENDSYQNKDKLKDKKPKAKFMVPIKSQIPVKDISYAVYIMNNDNIKNYSINLSTEVKEAVAVLIYSNNFNQLNRHHTDDSCQPEGVLVNIDNVFYYFKDVLQDDREIIANLFKHKMICFEGKDVINYLALLNIDVCPDCLIDVKIGSSLLEPDNPPEDFSEVQKVLSYKPQYTIGSACPLQKAAWYISLLKECVAAMTDLLIQNSLWNVFVDIEMRLLPVVAAMERRGVTVDLEKLRSMEDLLTRRMKSVEQSCYKAAGRSFQINSPLQISAILYDELQLDRRCNVKIRETLCKGTKSTSETMLRSLMSEHPLPRLVLEYRHVHKAHATFLAGIAQHVRDGVITATWVQTAAATGRIASSNPNLQAIPKAPFNLVMFPDDGEKHAAEGAVLFRSVYSSRAGHWLVAADFKHVECRVFAHVAADTALLHALTRRDDLFRVLAAKWLQKTEEEVASEDRERTKRIIYASMYGAGTRKLIDILNISYDQTLAIVASFNRTFPSLKSFGRSVVSRCEQSGGRLSTICGRTRQFKNISSEDFALRSQAERQAVNFVIQGSAADLCKMAMILTHEAFRKHNPPLEAHLVLQIHDELVWEVKDEHLQSAIEVMQRVMEGCGAGCGLSVPLPVDIRVGRNWADMTPQQLYYPQ